MVIKSLTVILLMRKHIHFRCEEKESWMTAGKNEIPYIRGCRKTPFEVVSSWPLMMTLVVIFLNETFIEATFPNYPGLLRRIYFWHLHIISVPAFTECLTWTIPTKSRGVRSSFISIFSLQLISSVNLLYLHPGLWTTSRAMPASKWLWSRDELEWHSPHI